MSDPLGRTLSILAEMQASARLDPADAVRLRDAVMAARDRHRAALFVAAAAEALCLALDHLAEGSPAGSRVLAEDRPLDEAREALKAALAGLRSA